jgi:hypothetical protein
MRHAFENKVSSESLGINLEGKSLVIFQDLSGVQEHAVALLVEALRCNRKVAGSIPEDAIEIFHVT